MKVILPSKSFEYTRKLYTRSTALAIPVIVDASLLSRYTQRYSSVSSNKHSHHRCNPKQHILLHSASASFPFQYLHPQTLKFSPVISSSRITQSVSIHPTTQLPQPPFPLHNKPSTSHRQSDLIPQHRKEPFHPHFHLHFHTTIHST